MSDVSQRPHGAKIAIPSTDHPRPLRPPRWEDIHEIRAWLGALRAVLLDATGAGEDATRRVSDRVFSRAEARRRLEEAEHAALVMLDAAEIDLSIKQQEGSVTKPG